MKTRVRIWRLRRGLDRIYRKSRREIAAAQRKSQRREEIESLESLWNHEYSLVSEELESLATKSLLAEAFRLRLAVPPHPNTGTRDASWEQGLNTGEWYLTPHGISAVRQAIRTEREERRKVVLVWVPAITAIITALAGLIGILTGLVAVWRR